MLSSEKNVQHFPMQNKKIVVLYVCTDWYEIGGSSASLFDLLHCMERLIEPIVIVSQKGKVLDKMKSLGIKTLVHPFFYLWERPKPIKTAIHHPTRTALYRFFTLNRKCVKNIVSELPGVHIDIVHSNSSITTVGTGLAKRLGAKHVWHIREFLDLDFGVSIYGGRASLRRLIDNADARICVSSAVAKHWNLTKTNTHVLWDAVADTMKLSKHNTPKEPYFLFCAANINERKGAETAVRAFCLSKLTSKGYCLKIVGHCVDKYREKLLSTASALGEEHRIVFIDYTDNITDYFAKATAFLMCSQCEALGRVTIQAMMSYCPVIAYNSGGTIDFIHQNETGFLFNTPDECADLMCHVVNQDVSQILDNAFAFANKTFSFDNYRDKLYGIYQSMVLERENTNPRIHQCLPSQS